MHVMRTPRNVDIDITNRCNLRCKYCYYFTGAGDTGQDLPTEEWLTFFDELRRCALMNVCLAGGEPFLRQDLPQLLERIVRNQMRFSLLSNGTVISEEMAAFLSATERCNHVQVSVDGSKPETHDAARGEGNFMKALKGIQILRQHRIPVTVRVTITQYNVADLEEIARLLLEEIKLPSFSTNAAGYMGLCRQNIAELRLTAEDRSRAMATLLKLTRKYHGRIGAQAGPLAEARQWLQMEQARQAGLDSLPGKGYLRACGGVMNKIAVRADGVMVPCTQMSHIELGRINQDDLQEVWQHHPELTRLRQRVDIPLSEFEFCQGCDYISYCTGNCPALAYTLLGKDNHPSPDACLKRFLEEGGRLPDEHEIEHG
jgi:SynChlorMet cassette radical SAM/SPASM protein ScmE